MEIESGEEENEYTSNTLPIQRLGKLGLHLHLYATSYTLSSYVLPSLL